MTIVTSFLVVHIYCPKPSAVSCGYRGAIDASNINNSGVCMNRTISGASIALLMGSMACSKQAGDTTPANTDMAAEDEVAAEENAVEGAASNGGDEEEYAWTDQDNPRCGHPPTDVGDNKFVCKWGNSCKAIGICKTEFNSCACYNSCKGKALWLVETRDECEDPGGSVVKELG